MDSDLDQILALQLTIAWAGEGLCQPARLGWWRTDLVDEAGGGDLFARLTPRLQRWSALEAARETARRIDEQKRREVAEPEKVRTLFHLGFREPSPAVEVVRELARSRQMVARHADREASLPIARRRSRSRRSGSSSKRGPV